MAEDPVANVVSGKTWKDFCEQIEAAGRWILKEGCPDDPFDRAEGFRLLTRLLRGALEQFVEYDDPEHPELVRLCHETIKVIAENPDNIYLAARIDPRHEYRVFGKRGTARWMSFNAHAGAFGTGGRGTSAALDAKDLRLEPDGSFELFLGARERPGNWLRLDPDATVLIVRQTLADRRRETPAALSIERLGPPLPPRPLDPAKLDRALRTVGVYLDNIARMTVEWANGCARFPNRFFAAAQTNETRRYKDPNISWHMAYFDLAPDEALVVEARPPRCDYWMFVLHNHWLESLDYRWHRIHLNNATARLEPDDSVRVVVAHEDPGHPNWLDTAGHRRGTIGVRWVGPNVEDVEPTARVVALRGVGVKAPGKIL
ncbi:MAG: hypothetical protein ACREQ9_17610 [Candidatus Binatia bacterium]